MSPWAPGPGKPGAPLQAEHPAEVRVSGHAKLLLLIVMA